MTKQKFDFTDEPPRNVIRMCATEHLGYYSHVTVIGLGLIHQNPSIHSPQLMEAT